MEQVWFSAALWLVLALVATMLSIWFRISTALSEIVVGTVAQLIIGALIGTEVLGAKSAWVSFLAGTGAIVLTFLAGAELDPGIFRTKWKEATGVGLVGFFCDRSWEQRQWRTFCSSGPFPPVGSPELPCPPPPWR